MKKENPLFGFLKIWHLLEAFQNISKFTFPQRKWQKMMHQLNTQKIVYKQVEKIISNWILKKGSENTVFGTKETNPRNGWYFITLKSLSWVNFQSQISKKIHWPLTSKTSPYKKINYKTFERRKRHLGVRIWNDTLWFRKMLAVSVWHYLVNCTTRQSLLGAVHKWRYHFWRVSNLPPLPPPHCHHVIFRLPPPL